MDNLYNRIESLCIERGINITTMCREAKVPRGNMTDMKMGRQSGLSAPNLIKIAEYFGVSVQFLQTGIKKEPAEESDRLNEYEIAFLEVARKLSPENRAKLLELAKLYIADQEAKLK